MQPAVTEVCHCKESNKWGYVLCLYDLPLATSGFKCFACKWRSGAARVFVYAFYLFFFFYYTVLTCWPNLVRFEYVQRGKMGFEDT